MNIGDVFLQILADGSKLAADIERQGMAAANKAGAAIGQTLGQQMSKGLQARGKMMSDAGSSMSRNLTLPIVAAGAAITAVGIDFDTAMRQIVALTDVTGDEIDGVRKRILELSTSLGKDPKELADGFYFLASAGFDTAEAMEVLESTAKASAVGLGQTGDVSKVVGAAINAFGKDNLTASDAVDQLIRAVKDGSAEASDFSGALGTVLGSAGQIGSSFSDVGAAIAAMTLKAISADEAATSLNQVFVSLIKPTKQAEEGFAAVGLSSEELRAQLREKGLLSVLQTLSKAFEGNETAAAAAFGNIRALRGIFALTTGDMTKTTEIFNDVAGGVTNLNDAFEETEGPGRDTDRAMAEIKVTLIELSDDVLPVTVSLLKQIAGILHTVADAFRGMPDPVRGGIVQILALTAALGPLLFLTGKVTSGVGTMLGALGKIGTFAFGARIAPAVAESVVAGAVEGVEAVPRNSRFNAGLSKLGQMMGGKLGPLLAAGILLAVDQAARFIGDRITTQYSDLVGKAVTEGNADALTSMRAGLLAQRAALPPWSQFVDIGGLKAANDAQLAEVDKGLLELKAHNEAGGAAAGEALTDSHDRAILEHFEQDPAWADSFDRQAQRGLQPGIDHAVETAKEGGKQVGAAWTEEMGQAIIDHRNAVGDAFNNVLDFAKNILRRGERIAKDIGILTDERLIEGLKDKNPQVRAAFEQVQLDAITELQKLVAKGGDIGKKGGEALKEALKSKNPQVREAAKLLKQTMDTQLDAAVPAARDSGVRAGAAFAAGAQSALNSATISANFTMVGGKKRPGGGGSGGDGDAAGGRQYEGWPRWVGERGPEVFVPNAGGYVVSRSDAIHALTGGGGGGGGNVTVNMPVSGALPVSTISDISGEMQRIDDSGLLPANRIAPMYRRRLAAGAGARR